MNGRQRKVAGYLIGAGLLVLCFAFAGFGQTLRLPEMTEGFNSRPEKQLIGPVSTVLSVTYRYDEVANTVVDTYDAQQKQLEKITFSMGEDIHSGKIFPSGSKRRYYYALDTALLTEIISLREDGTPSGKSTFHFDSAGRLTEEWGYSRAGRLSYKIIYQYLPESIEIIRSHMLVFDGRSSLFEKQVFKLNEAGLITSTKRYDGEGKLKDTTTFSYDKAGNLLTQTKCCEFNYSFHFAHKFDAHGNWVEQFRTMTEGKLDANKKTQVNGRKEQERDRIYRVITYR